MRITYANSLQKSLSGQKIKLVFSFIVCVLTILSYTFALASAPLEYNIIPETKVNSIVDTKAYKKLNFKITENTDDILYNGKKVKIKDNTFSVDVTKLSGINELTFTNSLNESVSFKYNFSDKNGKLTNYELVAGKDLNVYIKTIKKVKVIYTDKERSVVSKLNTYLDKLPENMLVNLDEIKLIPYSNTQNIAGTTKDKTILLYNYSKYSDSTKKNIIYHEIAHTWANKLIDEKKIDYSYTTYKEIVDKDNNYVSNYAKDFANNNDGRLSEDFADAVAFYFMNQSKFKKQYPNRTEYFKRLLAS